ncbi:DUF5776 domain-containing protein [Levilactobacillus spicheri]
MRTVEPWQRWLLAGTVGTVLTVGGLTTTVPAQAADEAPTSQTVSADHADEDPVTFEDPALATAVGKAVGATGAVTYGDIRHYQGKQPYVNAVQVNITSLTGLESLQELPAGIGISIQIHLTKGVSLAAFKDLAVSGNLTIVQDGMHDGDLAALNTIRVLEDPYAYGYRQICLTGENQYWNYGGLTNDDIPQLAPLLTQFANLEHKNVNGAMRFTFANQQLTDFSVFQSYGKIDLLAFGQYQVFWTPVTYIDPETYDPTTAYRFPTQVKGLEGEPIQTSTHVFYNDTETYVKDGTDALVQGLNKTLNWVILDHQYNNSNYPDLDPIVYADGSTLEADGMQYYALKWEAEPEESSSSTESSDSSESSSTSSSGDSSSSSTTTGGGSGSATTPIDPGTPSTTESSTATFNADSTVTAGSAADQITGTPATTGSVVYAVKPIYLYRNATFKKRERLAKYVQQPRINRPMFVVKGYARSANGTLRYRVTDVNHRSQTAGKTGYITANQRYTLPVYYQAKHAKITVINPGGVNAYRKADLKGAAVHYRQGTVLKVVGLQQHRLTTRFKLSNGRYVTANRKLVLAGTQVTPRALRTKTTLNRYRTANLTGQNGRFAAGKRLSILGWTYSRPDDFGTRGTLRYRVAGGYVTANRKFIQVIQ